MAQFFAKLNSPVALIVVAVLFVALNGFLFYGYQQQSLPSVVATQPATETSPASEESSADTSSEEEAVEAEEAPASEESPADTSSEQEAASETEEAPASEESPADTSSEEEAASETEEAPAPEEGAPTGEEANPEEAAETEEGAAPSEAAEAEGALRTVVSVVDAPTLLSVQVDGESVLEGVSEPGFSSQFEADRETTISTDNAGAVLVEVNGYGLGALGASGEPATRTFTAGA